MSAMSSWTYPSGWPKPSDLDEGEIKVCVDPEFECIDGNNKATSLTNLNASSKDPAKVHWRKCMETAVNGVFSALWCLDVKNVTCDLCPDKHSFEHCLSHRHFKRVYQFAENQDYFKCRQEKQMVQVWKVRGGGIRFNHLDGLVEAFGGTERQPPLAIPRVLMTMWGIPPPRPQPLQGPDSNRYYYVDGTGLCKPPPPPWPPIATCHSMDARNEKESDIAAGPTQDNYFLGEAVLAWSGGRWHDAHITDVFPCHCLVRLSTTNAIIEMASICIRRHTQYV